MYKSLTGYFIGLMNLLELLTVPEEVNSFCGDDPSWASLILKGHLTNFTQEVVFTWYEEYYLTSENGCIMSSVALERADKITQVISSETGCVSFKQGGYLGGTEFMGHAGSSVSLTWPILRNKSQLHIILPFFVLALNCIALRTLLWSRVKYFNNHWIDCHKFWYKHS